ncbi:DUF2306 domain-containing protein [Cohnella caldifontis]|uniref:DUF2306 domain-containing protein n=1 Tax=Cohnella caldifontis TaxID=3027471 RepID=UPI0023EDCFE1|nr:DUF2306 domain-containing protein [Cohnella sp. YIM B05605]
MNKSKRWWLLFLLSLGVMSFFSAPYLTLDPGRSRVAVESTVHYGLLVAHIGTAFVALIAGFPQFIVGLRERRPGLHRLVGRIYVAGVMISGVLALGVTAYEKDYVRSLAFLTLDALWLVTTWNGFRYAAKKDFAAHRVWMTRSFGMTLVAVSARVLTPILILLYLALNGFSLPQGRTGMLDAILTVNIWAGLAFDFVIVEWILLKKTHGASKTPSRRN